MKKTLLLLIAILITNFGISQTTLFSENFETGNLFTLNTSDLGASTTYNTWLMNNNYAGGSGTFVCLGFPFSFTVSNTPQQPVGITGNPTSNYMHIASQAAISSGINCASYFPSDGGLCIANESNFSKMTSSVSTVGFSGISFNFWWICAGSINGYGEIYYSLDNGTTWILKESNMYNVNSWTQKSLMDSAWDNKPNVQFGFRFVNNTASTASDPSFSIDDITIIADNTLGITNIETIVNSIIYPNPTNEEINIILNKTYNNIKVSISDISGKIIDTKFFKK
ncbi:MAG: T9SS type A sorting domain-containing protein [Flavobacterium sp.]|nr:T9SS type A sorting domain-containing protein [Flavobacterium sp.]